MSEKPSTASSTPPDPLIGRTIADRFKITGVIARGGMGKVYRAEQAPLGRLCAVKVLNPSYAGEADPEFHKRFFLEASTAAKLTHPNTVTIFDYGRTDDDIYFMAMEYLEGKTLHRAIREGTLTEARASHVARQICRSLREAHQIGVIHRDLKPANVFLMRHGDEEDYVKVLDFGLVKTIGPEKADEQLTQTGLFMGSPKYMAPEQIQGNPVDGRTDIYSLGVILYEMLTGHVPFDRQSSVNILMAHLNEAPPTMRALKPDVVLSFEMEALIMRSISKDPNARHASMDDLLADLKRISNAPAGTGEYPRSLASGSVRAIHLADGAVAYESVRVPGVTSTNGAAVMTTNAASAVASSRYPPTRESVPAPMPLEMMQLGTSRTGSGLLYALAGLAAAVVVGGGVLALFASRASHASAGPQVVVSVSPVVATPASAAQPVAQIAKLRVSSDPPGASVREDGLEKCSATPCELTYSGADADPTRPHALTIAKVGFKPELRTIKFSDGPIDVKLARAPQAAGPIAPHGPATVTQPHPPPPPDTATPNGFKDTPY